jgi:spectinomycin phosphotransferase
MLEKPNIPDERIISDVQTEYKLRVAELTFLPLGADQGSAVYRITTEEGMVYFLKLRRGFNKIVVTVPLCLQSQGIREIIIPFQTKSKEYWADFGEYKLLLYPFIEGKDGFDRELTDEHRRILGTSLKRIHTAQVPPELQKFIPRETFDAKWRESLKSFQARVENHSYEDPTAAKLADFLKSKRDEITRLIKRTEGLAADLRSQPLELVLCHTDVHGGNILIRTDGEPPVLYIVDWDNPLLAPKERDLMFIGGGIDEIWKSKYDEAMFFEGYGKATINPTALAYHRYERIIQDLVAYSEQLLLTDEGGADREPAYRAFASNFEPGGTIEIAEKTDQPLKEGRMD